MTHEEEAKIIEKVRKVMNLAKNAGSEEEADNAMRQAQAMLAKYNLDMSMVQEGGTKDIKRHAVIDVAGHTWARWICQGVAHLYFCEYFNVHTRRAKNGVMHCFVGQSHNVKIAEMISRDVVDFVNERGNAAGKIHKRNGGSMSGFWGTFRRAAAIRISQRCEELIEKAKTEGINEVVDGEEVTSTAMVVRDAYEKEQADIEKFYKDQEIDIKTRNTKANFSNGVAIDAGQRAGNDAKIELAPAQLERG
tara:strand:- start:1191 stop:1937 length:747 start_codon:yes stop_codon:yes gene_type:complete